MIKIMITGAVIISIFSANPTYAQAPDTPLEKKTVPEIVEHFASQYQVSAQKMLATMRCESSMKTTAIGDGGNSFGLSQIHLPSHPKITKEQAFDPIFASEFMAREFSKGNQRIWTCYRTLYQQKKAPQ